jgi:hypothetical protein
MNWQEIHPVVKFLIATILCMMIAGGTGYILYKFDEWCDRKEAEQKNKAAEPVDCTGIDFVYDSKGEIKTLGHELRKMSYERGKRNGV